MRTIYLDTETTGLHPPQDGVVEIAIVDDRGEVLLNELVNPGRPIGFASTIHGITDEMVADAAPFGLLLPTVERIVRGAHVVIYNAAFDTRFFPDRLAGAAKVSCAMLRFSRLWGPRASWRKLTFAADHIGYTWEGAAHRALADTLATRAVWNWLEDGAEEAARYA